MFQGEGKSALLGDSDSLRLYETATKTLEMVKIVGIRVMEIIFSHLAESSATNVAIIACNLNQALL